MTHTPGPWTVSRNAYGTVFVHGGEPITSSVGVEYKQIIVGGNSHDTLTIENARLIAAAPELLEELTKAVKQLNRVHDDAFRQAGGYGLSSADGRPFSCFELNRCSLAALEASAVLEKVIRK